MMRASTRRRLSPLLVLSTRVVLTVFPIGNGPLASQAQTITLVSNPYRNGTDLFDTAEQTLAQGFRAGAHPIGYRLTSIVVSLKSGADSTQATTFRVELWSSAAAGAPSAKVA